MDQPLELGRYSLFAKLATGGMATVFLGRLKGAAGFGRTVAIKRLHPHLARDPDFVSMFLDEARLAARVTHPNVVSTIDVVTLADELFLVLEYVKGESLSNLLKASQRSKQRPPIKVTVSIVQGALNGLHAAHEAKDERGTPLDIVHRDVSPQNILVGADGATRVLDFGIAKAAMRLQTTREGQLKGKLPYMPREQLSGTVTRRTDVYAAGVVLWESLACKQLFKARTEPELIHMIMTSVIPPPSSVNPLVSPELDRLTLRALAHDPEARFPTAREMAEALDATVRPASANQVAEWLEPLAGPALEARASLVSAIESHSGDSASRSEVRKLVSLMTLPSSDSSASLPRLSLSPSSDRDWRASAPPSSPSVASSAARAPAAKTSASPWRAVALAGVLGGAAMGGVAVFLLRAPATATHAPPAAAGDESTAIPPAQATSRPPGSSPSAETVEPAPLAVPKSPTTPRSGSAKPRDKSGRVPASSPPSPSVDPSAPAPTKPPTTSPDDILRSPTILDQH